LPGPAFLNVPQASVESSYYTWVDQHDTLGLGANVPIATGNLFDGVHALVEGKFVTLRIPYPLGFYAKGLEGRIDDAAAGWKQHERDDRGADFKVHSDHAVLIAHFGRECTWCRRGRKAI